MLDREDILLLIASGAAGPYPLDPIRVMKGCFIVSQAGRAGWREAFTFRAYDYGPFDSGVYAARDSLLADGLLQADTAGRYPNYSLTEEGAQRVTALRERLGDDGEWIRNVGRYVTSKSFSRLLDEVYARWPDFAKHSVRWA